MEPRARRTGVCILRVEALASGFVMTVLTSTDVERRPPRRQAALTDVEETLQLIRTFLSDYAAGTSTGQLRSNS